MQYRLSALQAVGLFLIVFWNPATRAENCEWQNKYKNGGYQAFPKKFHLGSHQPSADTAPEITKLNKKKQDGGLNRTEKLQLEVFESGGSLREAELVAKKSNLGILSEAEREELEELKQNPHPRAAALVVKKFRKILTPLEKVELDAYSISNYPRHANLAVLNFKGELKDFDKIEFDALDRSKGDFWYANLVVKKAKGEELSACEALELKYIEKSLNDQSTEPSSGDLQSDRNAR